MKYLLYLLLLTTVLISACETTIDLELTDNVSKLVVVGEITDQSEPHVTISRTAAYSDDQLTPRVSEANVIIEDDLGEIIILTESEKPGFYLAPEGVRGVIGRSYTLSVVLPNGSIYKSFSEELLPVAEIDSLTSEFRTDLGDDDDEQGWFVTLYFTDPPGGDEYYRWKFSINGEQKNRAEDIYSADFDSILDGEPIDLTFFEFALNENDTVVVEQLSLTKEAQKFLLEVEIQTKTTGGPLDPPVAPIIGNIRNQADVNDFALGYFSASSVVSQSIIINN